MRAMLFAAGLGTRLKPFTDNHPKALLPLGDKTLLQYQLEALRDAGIVDVVINVHHMADQIISYLHDHANFGCHIAISDERQGLLETGGGLRHAREWLKGDEPILACNVDILSNMNLGGLLAAWRADMTALLVVSDRVTQRYLLFDGACRLRGWTNIATHERRPLTLTDADIAALTPLAFSGMQVLSPRIFDRMDKVVQEKGNVFSLIDLYLSLVPDPDCPIYSFVPPHYRMMDVGKTEQLHEAERFAQSLSASCRNS